MKSGSKLGAGLNLENRKIVVLLLGLLSFSFFLLISGIILGSLL